MKIILNSKTKTIITAAVVVFILSILLFEHWNGGVRSHHLFARRDMPAISNWWGLLIVPVMTWILLSLMQKGRDKSDNSQKTISKREIHGFFAAFLFGIAMTILYYNAPEYPGYFMLTTFVIALFMPLYRPQFFLGFMLSMAYGFGGVLPVIFGLVLTLIYWIEYRLIRTGIIFIANKTKK